MKPTQKLHDLGAAYGVAQEAGCAIEYTSPDGIDYDEAAVKLASRLRINLWSAEASPVLGGVIHIPVKPAPAERQAER